MFSHPCILVQVLRFDFELTGSIEVPKHVILEAFGNTLIDNLTTQNLPQLQGYLEGAAGLLRQEMQDRETAQVQSWRIVGKIFAPIRGIVNAAQS